MCGYRVRVRRNELIDASEDAGPPGVGGGQRVSWPEPSDLALWRDLATDADAGEEIMEVARLDGSLWLVTHRKSVGCFAQVAYQRVLEDRGRLLWVGGRATPVEWPVDLGATASRLLEEPTLCAPPPTLVDSAWSTGTEVSETYTFQGGPDSGRTFAVVTRAGERQQLELADGAVVDCLHVSRETSAEQQGWSRMLELEETWWTPGWVVPVRSRLRARWLEAGVTVWRVEEFDLASCKEPVS